MDYQEREAWREKLRGRRVRVEQGDIWIEEMWWRWDEEEEVLREAGGKIWEESERIRKEGERGGGTRS